MTTDLNCVETEIIKLCGIERSEVDQTIADLREYQKETELSVSEQPGEVHLKVTAKAENEKEARKLLKPLVRELKVRFGASIYTTDEDKNLETAVVELLRNQDLTVTTIESCTGGALSARIVDVPGASEVFKQGFITYSNKAKKRFAMVKKSTLKEYGAVSEKCAREMAKGGTFTTGSDVGISVTGFAGPDGGSETAPVGTVFIGCNFKGKTVVREHHFQGDRSSIREQAVVYALVLLRECILENFKQKKGK